MSLVIFDGHHLIAEGEISAALVHAHQHLQGSPDATLSVFNRVTGRQIQLDFCESLDNLKQQVALQNGDLLEPTKRGRGRPRLGVVSREVSLLPSHWEWLESQSGGVSAALRQLIEQGRKTPENQIREARQAVEKAMQSMATDLPNYDEALVQFNRYQYLPMFELMATWPDDVQRFCRELINRVQELEMELKQRRRQN